MSGRNLKTQSLLILIALFLCLGCRFGAKESGENAEVLPVKKTDKVSEVKNTRFGSSKVDVIRLANKSKVSFQKHFGEAIKVTKIKNNPKLMPGEYREYRVEGHPKGLSVRFHRGKAKRFNLLLGKSEKSAKAALRRIFKINVRNMKRVKSDPLSDTWNGKSGSVVFKTAYAKRDKAGGKFVMLHAEIAK